MERRAWIWGAEAVALSSPALGVTARLGRRDDYHKDAVVSSLWCVH